MRFYLRRRSRLNQSILPAKNLRVEQLESRLLLHAAGLFEAHALFAPGTSIEYADEVHQLAHQIAQEYSSDDTSGHAHGDGCCCPDCSAVSSIAQFQFNDGNRWGGTSQSGGGLGQGDPTVVTWSIVPDGTNINGFVGEAASPSNLVSTFRGIYGIFDDPTDTNYVGEAWFEAIVSAFDRWSEVSGLEYVYESNDDGANFGFFNGVDGVRGDIRVGGHNIDGNSGTLAYNFFPNTSDMVIDTSDAFFNDTSNDSLRLRNVIAHEAGHGMGISHVESNNASFLMEPFINLGFDGPQFDDILATHRGYGDALEGNDSFATATDLGAFSDGDSMVIGADAFDTFVSATDTSFVSIDDDSDVDFFSFTVSGISTLDVMVDPIGPTYNQGAQNGSQSVFVASEQSDLRLEVYDRDGTTLIGESNVGGLGASELLSEIQLSGAGEYFIAVRGADNAAQMYRLELGVAEPVSTPGVTIFESSGSTEVIEGGSSDSYSVVLNAAPINDVTIAIQSTSNQVTLDTSFLVFNSTNWNVAQTVTVTANDDDTNEGDHSDVIRHSIAESGFDYNGIEIAGIQVAISDNDATPVGEEFFFSLKGGGVLEGLSVSDEDIVAWDGTSLRTVFDGSDVGLAGVEIDAFDVISETEILLSFTTSIGSVDDSDILYFQATSLGETTSGSFFWYVDGSDVSLTSGAEDIDAITLLEDGSLLFSTRGTARVPGLNAADEDVFRFIPSSLGSQTSGTFATFFDGSETSIQLNNDGGEDVDGVAVRDGELYLTSVGDFSVPGIVGTDDDVFVFNTTSETFDANVFLNLTSDDLGALDFAGIASASSIGIGGANAFTNPFVPFEMTEVMIGQNRPMTGSLYGQGRMGLISQVDSIVLPPISGMNESGFANARRSMFRDSMGLDDVQTQRHAEVFAAFESFVRARWLDYATDAAQRFVKDLVSIPEESSSETIIEDLALRQLTREWLNL